MGAQAKAVNIGAVVPLGRELLSKLEVTEAEDLSEHSNPFLRQFEDLDMKEDWETDGSAERNIYPVVTKSLQSPSSVELSAMVTSPTMLINYFTTIDRHQVEGENVGKFVKDFQRLMMPAV